MVKILAIGDPHFQVSNILEVDLFINKIEKLVKDEKPDLCVILGDLLHTHERLHTTALNKAYEFVEKMKKLTLTYVLVGNHDMESNQIYLTDNHWMNGMKEWENVVVVDKVKHLKIDKYNFIFCPYVYPGRFEEALNTGEYNWKEATAIFAHQEFAGCKMGAIISVEGDKWPLEYPNVISGHIHSRQTPQKNIYYCGSAMQHAFGESEENIIPIVEFEVFEESQDYKLREVDLELPRKKIVYMDVSNIDTYDQSSILESEDTIKLSVSGVYDEFKAFKKTGKYKELIDSGVKVIFKPKKLKKEKLVEDVLHSHENPGNQDSSDFKGILNNIISNQKNSYLVEVYELVVNNNEVNQDDIMFI